MLDVVLPMLVVAVDKVELGAVDVLPTLEVVLEVMVDPVLLDVDVAAEEVVEDEVALFVGTGTPPAVRLALGPYNPMIKLAIAA